MTDYTKLPDNVLRLIITNLKNDLEENNIDISDDYHTFETLTLSAIDETLQYFNIKVSDVEDYSYFIALCMLNDDVSDKNTPIKKPKLNNYEVQHTENVTVWKTLVYSQTIPSYIPLTRSMLQDLESESMYEYWDGRIVNEETNDMETTDSTVVDIIKK
jgi:hypothetical protein